MALSEHVVLEKTNLALKEEKIPAGLRRPVAFDAAQDDYPAEPPDRTVFELPEIAQSVRDTKPADEAFHAIERTGLRSGPLAEETPLALLVPPLVGAPGYRG